MRLRGSEGQRDEYRKHLDQRDRKRPLDKDQLRADGQRNRMAQRFLQKRCRNQQRPQKIGL
jgi:hypothetical protein